MTANNHFTVLQSTREQPQREAFIAAFGKVQGFTPYDGMSAIKHLPGFVARHLSRDVANSLKAALTERGIETEVVAEVDLVLPVAHSVRTMNFLNRSIFFTDEMGKKFELHWDQVKVIALACFAKQELKSYYDRTSDIVHVLESREEQFLEFLSDGEWPRIRLFSPFSGESPESGNLCPLDGETEVSRKKQFVADLEKIGQLSNGIIKNLSLEQYTHNAKKILRHANPVMYEQELAWLKWLASRAPRVELASAHIYQRFDHLESQSSSAAIPLTVPIQQSALAEDLMEIRKGVDQSYKKHLIGARRRFLTPISNSEADQIEARAERRRPVWKNVLASLGLPVQDEDYHLSKSPVVTWSLISACVLASIWSFRQGGQIVSDFFGFHAHAGFSKTIFQGVASFLMHGGYIHLLGNMYFLWTFGEAVEDRLGRVYYLWLVFISTFIGHLAFAALDPRATTMPVIGASGGISGVIAYYMTVFPKRRLAVGLGWRTNFKLVVIPAAAIGSIFFIREIIGAIGQVQGATAISHLSHLGGALAGIGFARYFSSDK